MSGDSEATNPHRRTTMTDEQAEAIKAWTDRRWSKKLQIADMAVAAVEARGLDPRALGITRAKIAAALFCVTESEMDEMIEGAAP